MSRSRASSKTTPLSNKAFEDVQRSMRRKIEQDNRLLSMYGSFFFFVEGKGIKLLTKDGQDGVHESPEIALQRNLSCLDWTYMLDRKTGELVVDIGVTFTPESDKPVTDLWRLDALEDSYGAAGFNWETIHLMHLNDPTQDINEITIHPDQMSDMRRDYLVTIPEAATHTTRGGEILAANQR